MYNFFLYVIFFHVYIFYRVLLGVSGNSLLLKIALCFSFCEFLCLAMLTFFMHCSLINFEHLYFPTFYNCFINLNISVMFL